MFQVDEAVNDPLVRSSALFSLVFALMSLSYGCVYIVQFGTMRSMDRASRWAEVYHNPADQYEKCSLILSRLGSSKEQNRDIVEYLGPSRYSCCMARMVNDRLLRHHPRLHMAFGCTKRRHPRSAHARPGPRRTNSHQHRVRRWIGLLCVHHQVLRAVCPEWD